MIYYDVFRVLCMLVVFYIKVPNVCYNQSTAVTKTQILFVCILFHCNVRKTSQPAQELCI